MLVLSRKREQRIKIGDDIEIVITSIKGNRVGVGIEAPAEVSIRREELSSDSVPRAEMIVEPHAVAVG
ncbi:carbon storage regulator [Roseiconus nitratireducens]|uniref:Translational regulator CsrA n=1 Tax=Roseiconus nitratireducens TaxID=2605748 RepID=A0A5M6CVI0_9BACT|nr:carbon storage regulator [Roseiconus nitratireducens]KAA5539053.1 carbon storage regulator [Roseiconus nitratireducens]